MSEIKFSPNLFLETVELNRLKRFIDKDGFRKNILDNTVNFGLIKSNFDISFQNGKVQQDTNLVLNGNTYQTIKINPLRAIDNNGAFITSALQSQIPIPNDGNWYWLKTSYQISNVELGTFALDASGNLTGTGNEDLTTILRGYPNFPSRVRFTNAVNNTFDYDVLQVTSTNAAQLVGTSFQPETGLQMSIVGTFTPGVAVPTANQLIFNYDSCLTQLIVEPNNIGSLNVRPSAGYVATRDFYIARVKVVNSILIIQDKRVDTWETKASSIVVDLDRNANPLIGIESVQFDNNYSAAENNIVNVSWGMRATSWTINPNTNVVTLFGDATGGKYKNSSYFNNGDFDGWRIYTENGKHARVVSSSKSGLNINLVLDVLDPDSFINSDGSVITSFTGNGNPQTIFVCPNAESINIVFTPTLQSGNETVKYIFPINTQVAACRVIANGNPTSTYGITYKYKNLKNYGPNFVFPADTTTGYYNESSFDANGVLLPVVNRTLYDSGANPNSFLLLNINPQSYYNFKLRVDKGDIRGVNRTYLTNSNPTVNIQVGVDKQYQFFSGPITLNADIAVNVKSQGTVEGNEFILHFDSTILNLNGKNLRIYQDYVSPGNVGTLLKTITQGDAWMLMNADKGGQFHLIMDSAGKWLINQSYQLPSGSPIGAYDNITLSDFDSTGLGITKNFFGYAICNGNNNTPNMSNMFLLGTGANGMGSTGGEVNHVLTVNELPAHTHGLSSDTQSTLNNGNNGHYLEQNTAPFFAQTGSTGGNAAHNNMPPYYTIAWIKRLF